MNNKPHAANHAQPQPPALLTEVLCKAVRRYRLPDLPRPAHDTPAANALAIAIETARARIDSNQTPAETSKQLFLESLAKLIVDAMHPEEGDFAFQAMVLQHQMPLVREYASLSARVKQDRRRVRAAVNTLAHPEKQKRAASAPQAEALGRLHTAAFASSWDELFVVAHSIAKLPEVAADLTLGQALNRMLNDESLQRLRRHEELESTEYVQRYQALRDQNGPRSGSADAAARGLASRKRGAAVEVLAAQALQMLAQELNQAEGTEGLYRVATSLRLPASLSEDSQRGKGEWDVVLLRKVESGATEDKAATPVWEICLLVEAKASLDSATTDLSRLVRGLILFAQADINTTYAFKAGQEAMLLSGASLSSLNTSESELRGMVLYCCDAPVEATPRLLGPAARMQLLSTPAGLEFAAKLTQNLEAATEELEPVWNQLLAAPQWRPVLNQYQTLRLVRELMVHPEDLIAQVSQSSTRR